MLLLTFSYSQLYIGTDSLAGAQLALLDVRGQLHGRPIWGPVASLPRPIDGGASQALVRWTLNPRVPEWNRDASDRWYNRHTAPAREHESTGFYFYRHGPN